SWLVLETIKLGWVILSDENTLNKILSEDNKIYLLLLHLGIIMASFRNYKIRLGNSVK
ncbi:hypothetical protein LOTGIDRAFT_147391, partial [Lottia gigantea]